MDSSVLSLVMNFSLSSLFILEMVRVSFVSRNIRENSVLPVASQQCRGSLWLTHSRSQSLMYIRHKCVTSHNFHGPQGSFHYEGTGMIFEFFFPRLSHSSVENQQAGCIMVNRTGKSSAVWAALLYL